MTTEEFNTGLLCLVDDALNLLHRTCTPVPGGVCNLPDILSSVSCNPLLRVLW